MNRQENTIELIFKTFSKDELDRLKKKELQNFLISIGLESYISFFPEMRSYTYEIVKSIINKIKPDLLENDNKFLFEQYMNENGLIDRENLKEMLTNHLSSYSYDEIESLLDDYFKDRQEISYEEFKEIKIF